MTEHAKHKKETKEHKTEKPHKAKTKDTAEHKTEKPHKAKTKDTAEHKTEKPHKAKTKDTAEHKAHSTHKEAKKAPTNEPVNQTSTIITTATITAIIVLAVFFGLQLIMDSSASWGSNKGSVDYAAGADGALVITEWSDFECPFCARALPAVNQIKETYGDAVIIEYKHFPLSFHPNAQKAAEASECARDQGKFWEYHDVLFENQNALDIASLKRHAVTIDLDTQTFNTCLDNGDKAGIVAKDMAEGQAFGVSGTPTFSVAGEKLVGAQPFSAFKPIIDKALAAGGTDYEAPEVKPDPVIEFIVIEDADCAVCDTTQVVSYTQTDLFPTAKLTTLQKNDARAIELIEELGINALPAYIFDEKVSEAAKYSEVAQAFVQVGDKYVINPSATGNVKLLNMPDVSGRPVKGDMDAPVTIIEWSDFECPFCARFYDDAYKQIVETYVDSGKAKIIFMHFPLAFHTNAENAAVASECAYEQGQFYEYHDIIFENQQSLDSASLKKYASDIGLDTAAFNTCYAARESVEAIANQMALGQSVGISGTPGFLINGITISGAQPFDVFEQLIEAELGN